VSSMRESHERPHELRLDLPAAHSAERMARSVLRRFALGEGVSKRDVDTLEFVASELLSNAVDHGGGERAMEEADRPGDVRMSTSSRVRSRPISRTSGGGASSCSSTCWRA
jgi:anti-sigma regulatory factor (Ser/Thr protein kinase)